MTRKRSARQAAALLAVPVLALAAAACGRTSHAATITPTSPATSVVAAVPTSSPSSGSPAANNGGPAATNGTPAAGSDLAAVKADEQQIAGATSQSDTDFDAGSSAQAHSDSP